MPLDDTLRSLLTAHGPSGYETAPAAAWREACEPFATVAVDVMGSCTATVPGTGGGPTVAIVGHIDEIGLVVTHVSDKGFLHFTGIGGWDAQVLVGQRVAITTRDGVVPGVVGSKPIHLLEPEDRKKAAELKNLHIDIGAKDADDARGMVRVGDVAVIAGDPVELPNDRVVSRSMDNRLGCYVALEAARLVAEAGGAAGDVVAVAAVQEEITFGGARTVAHALAPDVAIVVDVGHETDAPGVDPKEIGEHAFGSGAILERGSTLHPAVFEALLRGGRGRRDRAHGRRVGRPHGDRRRRDSLLARGHPDRARRPAAALHALGRRDGPAVRRARGGEADRRVLPGA